MGRINRSYTLLKASNTVFRSNPSLMVYPFISVLAVIVLMIFVLLPGLSGTLFVLYKMGIVGPDHQDAWQAYLGAIPFLLIVQWVSIYISAMFYASADAALKGEKLGYKAAAKEIWQHRAAITKWALFAGIVGVIIRYLEDKLGLLGLIVLRLLGIAWALATVFVVPTLVRKDMGPIDTLRHSANLFKKTWGENFTAQFSMGIFSAFGIFAAILMVFGLVSFYSLGIVNLVTAILLGVLVALVAWLFISYIVALQTIFTAALYRYAETGDYVGPYTAEIIQGAFTPKKSRKPLLQ